jgi:hypothetical protein
MPTFDQNNLSQLNFKFKLDRTPDIEYRAQSVDIPGMSLGTAVVPTPFVPIPMPGNLTYGDLTITFLVGENLKDYLTIFNWMVALGHPDNLDQYRDWRSDCSVFILDSNLNPNLVCRFTDAYPTELTGVSFDTTLTETQYATASVTFRFTRWYIEDII